MGDFVTFEIAKKLKEKGFREECLYHYPNCGEDYAEANYIHGDDRFDINTDYLYQCNNNDSYLIDAPTISQVLKWLREEKKIHITVEIDNNGWYYTVSPNVRLKNSKLKIISFENKESYEQATLVGIEYVLYNLI